MTEKDIVINYANKEFICPHCGKPTTITFEAETVKIKNKKIIEHTKQTIKWEK